MISMEKIKIKTDANTYTEFEVYPIRCKVGDTIWFSDDNDILEGIVTDIYPDKWWIYDDGSGEYGYVDVTITENNDFWIGQSFLVSSKDIIYDKPEEKSSNNDNEDIFDIDAFENELDPAYVLIDAAVDVLKDMFKNHMFEHINDDADYYDMMTNNRLDFFKAELIKRNKILLNKKSESDNTLF